MAVVLEVEEIVAELLLGESVGRGVEVVGELSDGAEVGVLSALRRVRRAGGRGACADGVRRSWGGPVDRDEEITTARDHDSRKGRVRRIEGSEEVPMTGGGRRGRLDADRSPAAPAAYLNEAIAADPLRGPLILGR